MVCGNKGEEYSLPVNRRSEFDRIIADLNQFARPGTSNTLYGGSALQDLPGLHETHGNTLYFIGSYQTI